MNAPARSSTIDPLLHPRDVARILNVSTSWLAKSRLSGDGPRFVKIGRPVRYVESGVREYVWHACVEEIKDWPRQRLIEPPVKSLTETVWESFPRNLREEIERYLAGFKKIRRGASGKRIRPCKESTVKTRRRELQAFARMVVRLGHPIETLTSLEALLDPALVEEVLTTYWDASAKEEPCTYTIDMAWKLLSVARETNSLSETDLAKLDDIRAAMEEHRQGGLTEKNLDVIRAVLTGRVWDQVVQLPQALMAEARLLRHQAPVKAAVTAQIATAIAILTFAPIRLGNLIQIRLEENLIKPGALEDPYWLVFPHYDVKNRVRLQFKLVPQLCEIIDEYIHDYRSVLLRGSNAPLALSGQNWKREKLSDFEPPDHRSDQKMLWITNDRASD